MVLVEEIEGPGDDTDLSWLLITTLPIETVEDVLRVIDYYVARWTVEIYFRHAEDGLSGGRHSTRNDRPFETLPGVLQNHCVAGIVPNVSKSHLPENCLAPPCSMRANGSFFPVWRVVTKKQLPKNPPTLSAFMKLLTQLGGYNNRATEATTGAATSMGWNPTHDRLCHRMARLRSRNGKRCV